MNGTAVSTDRRSLEIWPAVNGWIVRDSYRSDPLNQTPGIGAHVFMNAFDLAAALPGLLGEPSKPATATATEAKPDPGFVPSCGCPMCFEARARATTTAA